MRVLALVAALGLCGCAGSFETARDARIHFGAAAPARDSVHCLQLDRRHDLLVTAAWVEGSLAGASGAVAGALHKDVDRGWPIGLGASAAGLAALAVYSTTAAASTATEWVAQCE